jgi:hypothetical protein
MVEAAVDRLPWRRGGREQWAVVEDDQAVHGDPGDRPTP